MERGGKGIYSYVLSITKFQIPNASLSLPFTEWTKANRKVICIKRINNRKAIGRL